MDSAVADLPNGVAELDELEVGGQAFLAFTVHRISSLAPTGLAAADAQSIALEEWMSFSRAERSAWTSKGKQTIAQTNETTQSTATQAQVKTELTHVKTEQTQVKTELTQVKTELTQVKTEPTHPATNHSQSVNLTRSEEQIQESCSTAPPGSSAKDDHERKTWIYVGRYANVTTHAKQNDSDVDADPDSEEPFAVKKQQAFQRVTTVSIGQSHPDWLTEPMAVAQISLPTLPQDSVLKIPADVVECGKLSNPQLETVAYAARRFQAYLPNGMRCGYYLGDGTGCGMGRVIAALIWHLWNYGARRHIWLSVSADLFVDIKRDFNDLGASLPLACLSDFGYGPIGNGCGLDEAGNGVIFATYSLLVANRANRKSSDALAGVSHDSSNGPPPSSATSRLSQLIDWLHTGNKSDGGLIALDEAHRVKNVGSESDKLAKAREGSRAGTCALELQRACPHSAVLYSSATGATEIRHLGYLERLGLWGPGRPHPSFEALHTAVDSGGFGAMELLAMTMRAEGMLSCRSLSFEGTSFRLALAKFDNDLHAAYVSACKFWQEARKLLMKGSMGSELISFENCGRYSKACQRSHWAHDHKVR